MIRLANTVCRLPEDIFTVPQGAKKGSTFLRIREHREKLKFFAVQNQ